MEELFFTKIWEAVKLFFENIDWLFVLLFMLITWLLLEGITSITKLNKAITTICVLVIGVILASLYAYIYDRGGKLEFANLFYSVLMGMVLYKIGIDKLLEAIKNKLLKK